LEYELINIVILSISPVEQVSIQY